MTAEKYGRLVCKCSRIKENNGFDCSCTGRVPSISVKTDKEHTLAPKTIHFQSSRVHLV